MRRLLIAVAILTGIGGGAASYNGLTFVPAAHASEGDEIRQVLDRWVVAFRPQHSGHHVDLCARRGGL